MIRVTRLNGQEFVLNGDLIERLDQTPDTMITLVNSHKYLVREAIDEVLQRMRFASTTSISLDRPAVERAGPVLRLLPTGDAP